MELPIIIGISPTLNGIRGILAARDIKKGEIVEECPVLFVPKEQLEYIDKTSLEHYYFEWPEGNGAIALGYGSLINHSFEPNVEFDVDTENKTVNFHAVRDIKAGEELLTNYNGRVDDKTPLEEGYTNFKN